MTTEAVIFYELLCGVCGLLGGWYFGRSYELWLIEKEQPVAPAADPSPAGERK